MATHSSVLAWRIPGTGEPSGLPTMGSHRVGHDWSDLAAATCIFTLEGDILESKAGEIYDHLFLIKIMFPVITVSICINMENDNVNKIEFRTPKKVKVAQSCPTLCDPMDCSPWNSPGQNTRVDSLSLLQGIFPTQRSSPGLPHCRWILYQLNHKASPRILQWIFPTQELNLGLLHFRWILNQLSYERLLRNCCSSFLWHISLSLCLLLLLLSRFSCVQLCATP